MFQNLSGEFVLVLSAGNRTLCSEVKLDWEGKFRLRCWQEIHEHFNDVILKVTPQFPKGIMQYPTALDLMVGNNQHMIREQN